MVALLLTVAGCAQQPHPKAVEHPTIVSLNPCTDAILAEVADPEQILGLSHYSHDRASSSMDVAYARRFPAVSDSAEEVLTLRPDVVLAGNFMPPATVGALRRMGVQLVQLPIASSIAESEAQVAGIARLAGHPARGRALNARIENALARDAGPAGENPIPAVVWESGGIVPGDSTLIAELLRRTGFANFSAARGLRQADVLPLEEMLADPPRVILAAGNPKANEDRMLAHPALAALTDTRREAFPTGLLWCGGPTIIRAADRLAAIRERIAGR